MTVPDKDVTTLVQYCRDNLGDQDHWKTPAGYPDSLALCIIDSLYSTGSHYTSVINVINRYTSHHGHSDGTPELLQSIRDAGGSRAWAETIVQNLKPAHTKTNAPLKAEIIEQAATFLHDLGIDTVPQLRDHVEASPQDNEVQKAWKKLPSQSSGITYNYLLLLAGLPSVKPDRMVRRFLATALNRPGSEITTNDAVELVEAAAYQLEVHTSQLDHIIWRAASGRELTD